MRTAMQSFWLRVVELLKRALGCRPELYRVPRREVHRLVLDIGGTPRRLIRSSLRLRLQQLIGERQLGFCYSITGNQALLWYWSERPDSLVYCYAAKYGDIVPWPESLMRRSLPDGALLVECSQGFEAVVVIDCSVTHSRWFAEVPDERAWVAFLRDAGMDPQSYPLPVPSKVGYASREPAGWALYSSLTQTVPWLLWAVMGGVAILGAFVVIAVVSNLKIDSEILAKGVERNRLRRENAVTIELQRQIQGNEEYLNGFKGVRPRLTQLELMSSLVRANVLSAESKVSLAEWEYRDGRLRLLFSVPDSGFSLGEFLAVLEKLPSFGHMQLMPDTPPGAVGVQASIDSVTVDSAKSALPSR